MAMAATKATFLLCVVMVAVVIAVASAQPSAICNTKVSELAQCLQAVSGPTPKPPTRACCGVIRKANLPCMCKLKPQLSKYGLNPARVMALPKKCGVKLPSRC